MRKWHRQITPCHPFLHFSFHSTIATHGFYDSHAVSTNNEATNDHDPPVIKKRSARAEFRSLPVHSSILNSIEAIGVGLRPMHVKSRYMKSVRVTRRKLRNGEVMNEYDERNILRNRNADLKAEVELSSTNPSHLWMPLLPFGSILPTHLSNHSELMLNRVQVKKLPIKVLGSAGSRDDELPRSTKGLPEIAIAGRSNVGKSTLLNVSTPIPVSSMLRSPLLFIYPMIGIALW